MPAYLAVASNTSGSTAKDLFEDAIEELQKQVINPYFMHFLLKSFSDIFSYKINELCINLMGVVGSD